MIANEQEEVVLSEEESFINLDDEQIEEIVEEEVEEAPQYQIPDKFKGKSIEDIAKSYQELESEFGRSNSEKGELRRLTDELLQLQLKEKQEEATQPKELDVDTLLENPTEAINLATDARFKQLEERLSAGDINQKQAAFDKVHPDGNEMVQDPQFLGWVQASGVRQRMLTDAYNTQDFDMVSELLSTYKELHGTAQEEAQTKATQRRTKKLNAAKTETGSTGAKSTKVYRRADLINLRMNDRDRYDAMSDEITRAYAEGRVK